MASRRVRVRPILPSTALVLSLALGCSGAPSPVPDAGADAPDDLDATFDLDAFAQADASLEIDAASSTGEDAASSTGDDAASSTGDDAASLTEDTVVACVDGRDNDGDSYVDCGDSNCCAVVDCSAQPTSYCGRRVVLDAGTATVDAASLTEDTVVACIDSRDNDGDGYIDCGDSNCCAVVDCSAQPTSYCGRRIMPDAGPLGDGGISCTSSFGHALTLSFGRLDGTVRAVVGPTDAPCPRDDNHAIVQLDVAGATYEMWVNIQSTLAVGDVRVRFLEVSAPLVGPAWSEGWLTEGMSLDYVTTLGVHTPAFVPMSPEELVAALRARLHPGDRVSVFATGFASATGAHLIHYNGSTQDGAIVVSPETAPSYLLFQFPDQMF